MRSTTMGIAAATIMLATTTTAAALIWITATDPLSLAASVASGDVWTLLTMIAGRMLAFVW